MEMAKASEILKVLEKIDYESADSIIKALDIAANEEKSAIGLYKAEAEKNKGTELESFFEFMRKEEVMHFEKIQELKKIVGTGKKDEVKFKHEKHPIIHFSKQGSGEITAVLFALWREKKAIEFYSAAAAKTKGNVKAFFLDLVKFERGHSEMLEAYVESTQNVGELIMG